MGLYNLIFGDDECEEGRCVEQVKYAMEAHPDLIRNVYNEYLKRDATTGALHITTPIAVPNNQTTKASLQLLMAMLDEMTEQNWGYVRRGYTAGEFFSGTQENWNRIVADHYKWVARLDFYKAAVEALPDDGARLGDGSPSSQMMADLVVEPLLFGWYPNAPGHRNTGYTEVPEPFASQPPPFSTQLGQSRLDLTTPVIITGQFNENDRSYDQAWTKLKKDLKQGVKDIVEAPMDIMAILVIAAALGVGIAAYQTTARS